VAQKADAALKLYTTPGGPIVPLRQTRGGARYTPTQIDLMETEDEKLAAEEPGGEDRAGIQRR